MNQKNLKFFGGKPHFGPSKKFQKPKKKICQPLILITPKSYFRILFYYKIGDVCKKLDLNILKIDRERAILSRKKKSQFFFKFSNGRRNQK